MADIYVANHTIYLSGVVIEPDAELPADVDKEVIEHLSENDAIRLIEPKVEVKPQPKQTSKSTAKAEDNEV